MSNDAQTQVIDNDFDYECGCMQDECAVCNTGCTECGGEGWGVLGSDFSNDDPLWNGPDGQVIRCPNCHGSGLAKDMTYW